MKNLHAFFLIVITLLLGSCGSKTTSTPRTTPVESAPPMATRSEPKPIRQTEAISGSSFNKAFPAASGEYHLTFTQEKDGFASANLTKGAVKVATLSISDTAANPTARDKFRATNRTIGGYPAAAVGAQGTAVLVADRYQVQARSLAPSFTTADREAWLERFHLDALSRVRK